MQTGRAETKNNRSYRALIRKGAGPSGGTLLHLIRENAAASLCGLPREQLTGGGVFDELACPECIEWLPKRLGSSEQHPMMEEN